MDDMRQAHSYIKLRTAISELALQENYDVYLAAGAEEAFNLMETEDFDVVLTDLRMEFF